MLYKHFDWLASHSHKGHSISINIVCRCKLYAHFQMLTKKKRICWPFTYNFYLQYIIAYFSVNIILKSRSFKNKIVIFLNVSYLHARNRRLHEGKHNNKKNQLLRIYIPLIIKILYLSCIAL